VRSAGVSACRIEWQCMHLVLLAWAAGLDQEVVSGSTQHLQPRQVVWQQRCCAWTCSSKGSRAPADQVGSSGGARHAVVALSSCCLWGAACYQPQCHHSCTSSHGVMAVSGGAGSCAASCQPCSRVGSSCTLVAQMRLWQWRGASMCPSCFWGWCVLGVVTWDLANTA